MSEDVLSKPSPPYDLRLAYGPGPNQFIDLRFPLSSNKHRRFAVVLNIHGGFWRAKYTLEHAGHLCAALTQSGVASANIEYRRVGNEGGGWPGTFEDIRSAYQFVIQNAQKHNLDSRKMVVMGHSAGGQLALCLAAHEAAVRSVISLAGVVDLQAAYELHLSNNAVAEFLGGTPSEVPDHYREADPMQLSIRDARQWLIHGSADQDVPPSFSRDYVERKSRHKGTKEDARLVDISGAGHMDLIDPHSHAWNQVQQIVLNAVS